MIDAMFFLSFLSHFLISYIFFFFSSATGRTTTRLGFIKIMNAPRENKIMHIVRVYVYYATFIPILFTYMFYLL